ncbi:ribonucleotide-diphosphate reductase subunit alpha [Delftia phage PhiW-14]|uniref:Ribonucleoside-diphosphate reductase n=1 Tax=Delftia phage PhiW-14 TaxID=665032 RepID=C9DFZ9_BPW14|nr:ribonucleotide reductase [Delftia phage PhiW-14]ACV50050.1 ribonucleotide-diphosphate reductase subunit alpha [Delftia phage PhiW-14]
MTTEYLGIIIDETRTDTSKGRTASNYLITQHYSRPGETIQQTIARAAVAWSSNLAHAQRLYDYASKDDFIWASPAFSNATLPGEKIRAMPISCFLPDVPDSVPGLLYQKAELSLLSVLGGGVGQNFGGIRSVSDKAPGPIPFIAENDSAILAWKQGKIRRGALSANLGVTHPDTMEFMRIRVPTGDIERKSLNIHHGFNVTDEYMQAVVDGIETLPLIDPTGKQVGSMNPREHFREMVTVRSRTGEPFMYFIDRAQEYLSLPQKLIGMACKATNICTEITLAATKDRTPVCCLCSINAERYEDFKPYYQEMVSDLIEMLDNIIEFFVQNVEKVAEGYADQLDRDLIRLLVQKVKKSAECERSVGLGVMGLAYMLQRADMVFAGEDSREYELEFFRQLKDFSHAASCRLGIERGVPPDIQAYLEKCKELGIEPDPYWVNRRNLHLLAIAPNANSSVILNTSASIEFMYSNVYSREMRTGTFEVRNRYLEKLLESQGRNTEEVWNQIKADSGSVKGLDFLTEHQKRVYAVPEEMNMMDVVVRAGERQVYICQAQSLNLFFPPGSDINFVMAVHILAWKVGVKSLYYYKTESEVKIEKPSDKTEREKLTQDERTIVYGTKVCPHCNNAKALLKAKGIEFEYIDLQELGKTAAEVTGRPVRTVPQIYLKGHYVGGFTELVAHLNKPVEPIPQYEPADQIHDGQGAVDDRCVACEA